MNLSFSLRLREVRLIPIFLREARGPVQGFPCAHGCDAKWLEKDPVGISGDFASGK